MQKEHGGLPVTRLVLNDYQPSRAAWDFHRSLFRFRYLIWGIKSGKTKAGAREFFRGVMGSKPGSLSWIVAPTYNHLEEAERELQQVFNLFPHLVERRNRQRHFYYLVDGRIIQCKSADWPDNLRGPNVDGVAWFDECGFAKSEAHYILRERVAATGAPILYTTTPHGRNWVWNEIQLSGIPPDTPYGEFFADTDDGGYYVSHHPTWHFPWVPKSEIEYFRKNMSKIEFEQELGAMFLAPASRTFHHVEECMTSELAIKRETVETPVMGLDLAKVQDFTSVVVMNGAGRALYVDRWNDVTWSVQRPRIIQMAKDWNNATIVLDRANVGSVIEEDLRNAGLNVRGVEMNAAAVKNDLIESLQIAFERRSITIPDPKAQDAGEHALQLYRELCWYETGITSGGRATYSAPKGLTDDMVVALALANWGRMRGLAGGADASGVAISPEEMEKLLDSDEQDEQNEREAKLLSLPSMRPKIYKNIFGSRKSMVGFDSFDGSLWG